MGYDIDFDGQVTVTPPLNAAEVAFLKRFAKTRHCACQSSKWVADETLYCPPDRRTYCTASHLDNPGYYCKWEPSDDGTTIQWNEQEKFDDGEEWMQFLIEEFLKPNANIFTTLIPVINGVAVTDAHLIFEISGHVLNGVIDAQGEEPDDRWKLVVKDNVVTVVEPTVTWPVDDEPVIVKSYVVAGEIESGDVKS